MENNKYQDILNKYKYIVDRAATIDDKSSKINFVYYSLKEFTYNDLIYIKNYITVVDQINTIYSADKLFPFLLKLQDDFLEKYTIYNRSKKSRVENSNKNGKLNNIGEVF